MITESRKAELRRIAEERREQLRRYEPTWLRVDREGTGETFKLCAVPIGESPTMPYVMNHAYMTSEELSFFEKRAAELSQGEELAILFHGQGSLKAACRAFGEGVLELIGIVNECQRLAKEYSRKHGRRLFVCMPDSLETLEQWRKEGMEHYLYDEQDRSLAETGVKSAAEATLIEQINEKVDALLAATDKENKRRSRAGRKGGKKNAGRIKDAPELRKKAIEDARGHRSRGMTQEAAFTTAIEDNGLDITWQALRAAYFKKYPRKNKSGRFK